jgi:hypothetical protein
VRVFQAGNIGGRLAPCGKPAPANRMKQEDRPPFSLLINKNAAKHTCTPNLNQLSPLNADLSSSALFCIALF